MRLVPILIILIVLPRVSSFVRSLSPANEGFDVHDLISVAFALALGLGTIATSYFSSKQPVPEYDEDPRSPREARRRERELAYYATMHAAAPAATAASLLFGFLDSVFNLADAFSGASTIGLFATENASLRTVYYIAVTLFGLSPTILAITLAKVVSMVDRIPENYERPMTHNDIDWVRTIMGNLGIRTYKDIDASDLPALPNNIPDSSVRTNRTPNRTPNRSENKSEAMRAYLDRNATLEHIPSVSELVENFGVAKATASEVRSKWINNRDVFRGNGGLPN